MMTDELDKLTEEAKKFGQKLWNSVKDEPLEAKIIYLLAISVLFATAGPYILGGIVTIAILKYGKEYILQLKTPQQLGSENEQKEVK